ncbi:MAG: hypothetical protein GY799_06460 [Desulfobulbaceae bacterium]|nr:hypothetical protein [Desulfobulbaceae bacterium]
MIFGEKSDFAIEAMVEVGLESPSFVWGRLRVWIQGGSIGDYDDPHCGLYPSYQNFKEKITMLNSLWSDEFSNLTDIELWNILDGSMYGYHGTEEIDYDILYGDDIEYWKIYGKFNFITNWGEMFDQDHRGKAFVFNEPGGKLKVLTRHRLTNTIESLHCNLLSFRRAAYEYCSWFEKQELILNSKNA